MTSSGSLSLTLPPNTSSITTIFLKSQFTTPPPLLLPEACNLSGKTALITGSSSGLGYHACIALLSQHLSTLILGVCSLSRGQAAASKLLSQFPAAKIIVWELEMSSYTSIQSFVSRVEKEVGRIDIAILNAGIVKEGFGRVGSTGHEEVVQVNYLSTVLLSILLLPSLKAISAESPPGRLSIVGSGTALAAQFPNRSEIPLLASFDDEKNWDPNERYWCSKLLGHYFMTKLVQFVDPRDVIVNIVDPGLCKGSGLLRDVSGFTGAVFAVVKWFLGRKLNVGASTYVDAVLVKGEESHGCYLMDWKICPFATLLYAPDSEAVTEILWDETMKELEFAQPLKILDGLKH